MDTKIVFHFILADNDVDGDDEAFTNGALEEICKLCIGHYGLFDGTEVKAKITNASIMDSCGATKDGRHKRFIYAEAEFPNNECGRKLISKILLEKPIASIACSALNRDKVADGVTMISNVTDFYNFSLRFDEEKETMNNEEIERRLEAAEKQNLGLLDEIKWLKEKLAEQDKQEIPDFPEFDRWDVVYKMDACFDVMEENHGGGKGDKDFTGDDAPYYNDFHTADYAHEFRRRCLMIAMMLHCKWYVDRDYTPDWSNENQDEGKWQVFWSNMYKRYEVCDWISDEYGSVFFSTEEAAQKCADWMNVHWKESTERGDTDEV